LPLLELIDRVAWMQNWLAFWKCPPVDWSGRGIAVYPLGLPASQTRYVPSANSVVLFCEPDVPFAVDMFTVIVSRVA
jgi:hypothetical protein